MVLNSAASIYIAKENITFEEAIKMAEDMIDSGKAKEKLEKFIELTNR